MINRSRRAAFLSIVAVSSLVLGACSESKDDAKPAASSAAKADSAKKEDTKKAEPKKEEKKEEPKKEAKAPSHKLTAEGASSQQKAMDLFRVAYEAKGGQFSYNPTGSGSGQKQFIGAQVDFGGSDSPLKEAQIPDAEKRCGGNPVWHLPMAIGPVAIAYNLKGVDSLTVTPDLAADIFSGKITKWNDPALAAVNAGVALPDEDIKVVYRSEESGTSDNFQKFLKAATGGKWATTGKAFPKTIGAGAKGSSGVAKEVAATEGAITYVEAGFVDGKAAKAAKIDFGSGPVELNPKSVGVALDNLKYKGEGNNMVVDANALFEMKDAGAYPLVLTTYELVCSKGYDAETAAAVKAFLNTMLENQNDKLASLGYIPVSGAYAKKLKDAVDAIS